MSNMEVDNVAGSENVPQSQPLCPEQVMNNAGGFGWKVDDMNRLRRFLCLGCEGGTYYQKERELGLENALCIQRLVADGKGVEVVKEIQSFSVEGRAAKQDPIIFALALCARKGDGKTKKVAYEALAKICRIPTHLFSFVEFAEKLSQGTGWGRAHRRAVAGWYAQFAANPQKLAMHVTKYKNRNGWTHKDVLRLAHLKPTTPGVGAVTRYVVKGIEPSKADYLKDDAGEDVKKVFAFLEAVEKVKGITDEEECIALVHAHGLVREHLPTPMLNSVPIWKSLMKNMPMTAMIRNLGKMSALGLFEGENSHELEIVVRNLGDVNALRKARIHPFNVLVALMTYKKGAGDKGKLTWPVSDRIVNALDGAFYSSFKAVEPTNQRYCLALDVSGSMGFSNIAGANLTPREAAAAMMMTSVRTERTTEILAFSTELTQLTDRITADMRLEQVLDVTNNMPFGGTDCALPMVWAKEQDKKFDNFVVYTDNETWFGKVHPAEALRQYRLSSGIWNAKLMVVAMSSGEFTIADPADPGMLDMVGFDSAAPAVMREFALGNL